MGHFDREFEGRRLCNLLKEDAIEDDSPTAPSEYSLTPSQTRPAPMTYVTEVAVLQLRTSDDDLSVDRFGAASSQDIAWRLVEAPDGVLTAAKLRSNRAFQEPRWRRSPSRS